MDNKHPSSKKPTKGIEISSAHITPDQSLLHAAQSNDINGLQCALSRGANIDYRDVLGQSALHIAASMGFQTIASHLLQNDANIEIENTTSKYTPLHYAIMNNNLLMADLLLEHGASIDRLSSRGSNAKDLASNSSLSSRFFQLFILRQTIEEKQIAIKRWRFICFLAALSLLLGIGVILLPLAMIKLRNEKATLAQAEEELCQLISSLDVSPPSAPEHVIQQHASNNRIVPSLSPTARLYPVWQRSVRATGVQAYATGELPPKHSSEKVSYKKKIN